MGIKELPELQNLAVAGRIAHFQCNWRVLTKDQWVLEAIQGVQIEFLQPPQQMRKPHTPHHSQEDRALVKEEVGQLLAKGAIKELLPQEAQKGF